MTDPTSRLSIALAERYKLIRQLGEGGMATVYLAEDIKHERQVALKVLRPELAAVLGAERFVQEIKTTANLQHPHILPLFDSGEADSFLYYVMPYIDGETLRDKLNRDNQLGIDEAVKIATEVADALDYAHRQGIVHRDIKPENILMHDGRPMVADFGIALAVSAAAGGRMTETGLSLGTPHYMSPEQATAEKDLTARADVYSLGAVLYEMLTGEPPHMGNSAQAIIMKIVTDTARPVTELRKSVPRHIAAAAAKALEKLPADRFGSASEFAAALNDTSFTTATAALDDRRTPGSRQPARTAMAVMGAVTLVALIIAAWSWLRPSAPATSRHYRIALSDSALPPGTVGRNMALSPDGQTIVFTREMEGARQLWAKRIDQADPTPLAGTEGAEAPTFSPDGRWIAFMDDGRVRKVPRLGGSPVTIAEGGGTLAPSIAWLDDGTVLFNDAELGLKGVGEDGGPVTLSYRARALSSDTLLMFPVTVTAVPGKNATILAMCDFGCNRGHMISLDLESGARKDLGEGNRAWFVEDDRVVLARFDGGVFIAPFDRSELGFVSPPVPVLDGVRTIRAASDMVVSSNGTLIYAPGESSPGGQPLSEMIWVTRDGRVAPVDEGWTFEPASNLGLALSPDGSRLAVAVRSGSRDEIWIKELDRGPFARLTFDGMNIRPEWSTDGRYVLYPSSPGNAMAAGNVARRRSDGTGSAEVLSDPERAVWEIQQLPDTGGFLIRLGVPPSRDIYRLDPDAEGDDSLQAMLARDVVQEVGMRLSPNGRWLAYTSDESGRREVYVRPFPEIDSGRWQVSLDGGSEPVWAHSGRELFFRATDGNLMAVEVSAEANFSVGSQTALFSAADYLSDWAHRMYDVDPNDQRFLFARPVGDIDAVSGSPTVILIENWIAEVDRILRENR